jgi:hypothetical protein
MKKITTWMLFFGLLLSSGCDTPAPSKLEQSTVAASPPNQDLPIVERAEYVNWSQFPVGTTIKHVRETKSDVDKVIVTTTSRLASKTDAKVVIETQVTVDRGGEPLVNPSMELEFPASFRLPPNMDELKFALPAQNAEVSGEETVQFNGKDYAAVIYTWSGSSEAGPTKNKMWFCKEIPGRVFRHEMSCTAFTTLENVTEIEIPKT